MANLNDYKISIEHDDINKFIEKEQEEKRQLLHTKYFRKKAEQKDGKDHHASSDPSKQAVGTIKVSPSTSNRPANIQWDQKREEEYQCLRVQAKDDLCAIARSVKYIDCGFSNCIQKVLNNDQVKDLRNQLLNRYMDGRSLTPQELKYLALTSETLNRFLDKKEYQHCADILEPEFISTVRLVLTAARDVHRPGYSRGVLRTEEYAHETEEEISK